MQSSSDRSQLYRFAKNCLRIRSQLSLGTKTLTPLNFYEEKEKFLKSHTYSPQFVYPDYQFSLADKIQEMSFELTHLKIPPELHNYFNEYLSDLKILQKTINSVGSFEFPYYAKKLYSHELIHIPEALEEVEKLRHFESSDKTLLNAAAIADEFKRILNDRYQISNFPVEIDSYNDHTIRVGINGAIIGSKIKRYRSNVRRLIVHEIETHALQAHNIKSAHNPLVRMTKHAESLVFGEGMAVYNEYLTNTLTRESFETYYYRLQAVQLLHLSFRDIFSYLSESLSPNKAFSITARVKRGMADTGASGGFPKDAGYFLGFKKIKDYIAHGSNLDFLYIGKVPYLSALLLRHNLLQKETVILPRFLLQYNKSSYEASYSI